ncbi:MAG: GNAT family N-acetyltransferase, partial [Akkermansiaceae bacterium]|nr:GNAT family N-acetyltransferase [Armatimonadota bacterium]
MPDLLVALYRLPVYPTHTLAALEADEQIVVRRAHPFDLSRTRRFIARHFSESWADEAQAGFTRQPITTFLAIHEKRIVGFASVDATAKGFFGPTGVDPALRGKGIGSVLLLVALHALRDMGYGYAVIGAAGPVEFYEKTVGATVIPNSTPGVYQHLLGP